MVVVARRDLSRRAEIMWKTRISLAQVGELNSYEFHILQGLLWGALELLLGCPWAPFGFLWGALGLLWGALGLLLRCPWAPFGVPLGSLWPASGSPVPGEVASSQVPRIAIRSAFFELIPRIPGIRGIRGSGVIQCCSEPPFHTRRGSG